MFDWYKPIVYFNVFGINIYVWGMMLALGILSGVFLIKKLLVQRKVQGVDVENIVFWSVLGGIVGSRLWQVVVQWQYYQTDFWSAFRVWEGGLASFGGYFGGLLVFMWMIKKFDWKTRLDITDALAPSFALALSFTRFGCFLINDHWGKMWEGWLSIMVDGVSRHPISLYYALVAMVLSVGMYICYQRKYFRYYLLGILMIGYAVTRLLLDYFFKDYSFDEMSWWWSIFGEVVLIILGIYWIKLKNKIKLA